MVEYTYSLMASSPVATKRRISSGTRPSACGGFDNLHGDVGGDISNSVNGRENRPGFVLSRRQR